MNSRRSARRSRRSRDSQQKSEGPGRFKALAPTPERADDWKRRFTPEQVKDLEEMAERLRMACPWLEAEPQEVRRVAWLQGFPRSMSGKRQDDQTLAI